MRCWRRSVNNWIAITIAQMLPNIGTCFRWCIGSPGRRWLLFCRTTLQSCTSKKINSVRNHFGFDGDGADAPHEGVFELLAAAVFAEVFAVHGAALEVVH